MGDGQRLIKLADRHGKLAAMLGHHAQQQMRPALERLVSDPPCVVEHLATRALHQVEPASTKATDCGDEV